MMAAQALGALEAGESRSLENHLAECAQCRTLSAKLDDTAAALAYSVEDVEPSPGVRALILEKIKAETRTPETVESKQSAPSNDLPLTHHTRCDFIITMK